MRSEYDRGQNYKWLDYIENILISVGQPDLFNQNFTANPKATKAKTTSKLNDLYIQDWYLKLQLSSKGRNYSIFKETINIKIQRAASTYQLFRTSNSQSKQADGKISLLMIESVFCVS